MAKPTACVTSAVLALCAARGASACPPDYSPFGEGEAPRAFPIHRCAVVERDASRTEGGFPVLTLARSDDARRHALLRVGPTNHRPGTVVSVLDAAGNTVVGPRWISDLVHVGHAFWADLNGDGREDFIQFVDSLGCGLAGLRCDLVIALSSEEGYGIVAMRTMSGGPEDFIDLGDGRCRLVQTSFVYGRSEKGTDGKPHNYWVHHLIEFDGAGAVVSKADPRFPVWVWYTHKPNHEETTIITSEQKQRLWTKYADRIVRPAQPLRKTPVRAERESRAADKGD